MLLEVVADTGDVGRDLDARGQADTGHLAQGRVRLLRGGRVDAGAHPPPLGRALQGRGLGLRHLGLPSLADELGDCGHALPLANQKCESHVRGAGAPAEAAHGRDSMIAAAWGSDNRGRHPQPVPGSGQLPLRAPPPAAAGPATLSRTVLCIVGQELMGPGQVPGPGPRAAPSAARGADGRPPRCRSDPSDGRTRAAQFRVPPRRALASAPWNTPWPNAWPTWPNARTRPSTPGAREQSSATTPRGS